MSQESPRGKLVIYAPAKDATVRILNAGFARNPEMRIFSLCPAGR